MRKTGFGLFLLLCVGAVALLWRQTGREEAHARRGPTAIESPEAPAEPEETSSGLAVTDGVAQAPAFEEAVPADAPAPVRFWAGRAVSASTRQGVAGATVVLESLGDPAEAWAQPATADGGFFTLRAPPEALQGRKRLRVVVESPAQEVGLKALVVGEETVTDLGTVLLSGKSVLEGRVVDEQGEPAPDVSLNLRGFGELEVRPGVVAGATSDERGAFRLERLPRGSFVLAGIGPQGRRYLAAPVLVPLVQELVVAPLPAADLEVEVYDTLHEPVAGAVLEAIPQGVDPRKEPLDPALFVAPFFATTNSVGVARFPFLYPRTYTLFLTLPGDSLFEFPHPHAHAETRRLVVPADPRLRILLVEAPEQGPPARPVQPLRQTTVQISLTGRTSMPERTFQRSLGVTTDEDGMAFVPRLGTTVVHVKADAPQVRRRGEAPITLAWHKEGIAARWIAMRPVPAPDEGPKVVRTPRRARVTLPGGVPVKGAKVYVGRKVETNEEGEADLGPAKDDAKARLFRPDLASGDPDAGEFGRRTQVELTWNEGEVVTVRVSDSVDGFPLSSRVRIYPRPSAWRVVEPGLFRSRWDVAYADPDRELVVRAPGYDDWRAPGGPGEFEARLLRPLLPTATLELEVLARNAPLPGIWVSGRLNASWRIEAGRRDFIAMTGGQGRVDVAGLAEGPWIIRADAGARGSARRDLNLARGRNPLPLHLVGRPLVRGIVVDDRKRPVAGARIERVVEKRTPANRKLPPGAFDRHPQLPAVRTDRAGHFGLGLPHNRRMYVFLAKAPGHHYQYFEVAARPRKKRLVVTLPRLAAVALPLKWVDGRGRPIPDDIVMSISRRLRDKRWIDTGITAHVVKGRLRATGLPPVQLRFSAVRGSAWAPAFVLRAKSGRVLESPPVQLRSGGTIEGEVTDGGRPLAAFLLYVGTRPARTDAQGKFRVTGLPPRVYAIQAEGQTEESRLRNRAVRAADGFVGNVAVRISRGRGR
ncbi:MAG: hypothetical protein ACYSUM_09665 [Planctomycetota bacterium]